ncbi:CBS domain-containing protein [Bacillus alveayuensis]|uniref:CBS domain-containing protein n=1 Tax=Aeribacillus alveayuensis TaxID=279215 RepID=UPI0005D12373|nr:CBS domain-containing protein [Bacillus alveayuensis]
MLQVRDMMTTNIDYCTPLDNVYEAAVKMKDLHVDVIPIVQNNKLVGVVTDRDLVVRCMAEKHPGSTKITDVMSDHLVTVTPQDSVDKAAQLMSQYEIYHLPVVENGQIVGMVSLVDLSSQE